MKAVVTDAQQRILVCKYMQEKTDVVFDPAACQGFAILNDEGIFVAGVLISNVRSHNGQAIDCEISCASEHSTAWQPSVCRAVFGYIFNQLGCVRCTSITKKNNNKSRAFLEALNFKLEGTVRKGYDGLKDALIYGLLAGDCQFVGDLDG